MKNKNLIQEPHLWCFLFVLFMVSNVNAQTVVTFLNPLPAAPTACNSTWTENGIFQTFDPTDCSSPGAFDYSSGKLSLFPATLLLDLSTLGNISRVEIDVADFCEIGCSNAEFFVGFNQVGTVANATSGLEETMVYFNTNGDAIDGMSIQSFEAEFYEIRIYTSGACAANADVHTESGDVYVEDSCHGVILTSPNGTCYRIRVDDNGNLLTEQVDCP